MIEESIQGLKDQLKYEPEIQNSEHLLKTDKFVVAGMGGSALAADLLRVVDPRIDLFLHRSYDLPGLPHAMWDNRLVIASSYSGNTEETISAFEAARSYNLPLAVVSVHGKLIELAKQFDIPYVQMPDTGIQPRMALGFSMKAILKLMGREEDLARLRAFSESFSPENFKTEGEKLAATLRGSIPIIYASHENRSIAYVWKITFNETGKIPAFANIFPELNHNEMTGFDVGEGARELTGNIQIIMLRDQNDHPQIKKRMDATASLLQEKGIRVISIDLASQDVYSKIFSASALAGWAAFYSAKQYGAEAEQVPMVESFKKLLG